jgi:hypothetical protein
MTAELRGEDAAPTFPGAVLPVSPSTLRNCRDLQKLDPSGDPSGGVRDPSGSRETTHRSAEKQTIVLARTD